MTSTEQKTSWADAVAELDHDENKDYFDENSIRTTVQYVENEEGKKVKITRRIKRTLQKSVVDHAIAERQTWAKFGQEKGKERGPDWATTTVGENIWLNLRAGYKSDMSENVKSILQKAGAGKVVCRLCKGDHFTAKCPYKDTLGVSNLSETAASDEDHGTDTDVARASSGGKYVPPSKRAGGARTGDSKSGHRDDLPTLRVTNISEDTDENDLRELFGKFGRVARVYVGRDWKTRAAMGYAFVSFDDKEAAQRALGKLNGRGYDNLILSVQWSKSRS